VHRPARFQPALWDGPGFLSFSRHFVPGYSHCVPPPPVGIRLIKFDGQVFSGDLSDEACGDIRTIVDRVGEVGRFRIAPQGQERAYPNDQR
jgi:hypothetical protein